MKKLLMVNMIVIALVIALTAGATFAYFSAQDKTMQAEITTAKLGINSATTSPIKFENMLPGNSVVSTIEIQNTSLNASEDFYLQMMPETPGGDTNFCYKFETGQPPAYEPKVWLNIVENGYGTRYDGWICPLYPTGDGRQMIAKLSDNVLPTYSRTFTVTLTLDASTGNSFQGKTNKDKMNLIAVQFDGPAPVASNNYNEIWPVGDGHYGN